MTDTVLAVALSALRIVSYLGFVLFAGTLTFVSVVWPQGRRHARLVRMLTMGAALLAIGTVTVPLVRALGDDASLLDATGRTWLAAALVRLAVVVGVLVYLPDLVARDIHRWRTFVALSAAVVVEITLVAQSDAIDGRWSLLTVVATMGHLAATAAWLGGLAALSMVLVHRHRVIDLHSILPSFSKLALASVITLLVTGLLHAVAVTGGIRPLVTSSYGVVLGVKVCLFGLMLLLGDRGRRYASRLADRPLDQFDDTADPAGIQALAVALGAEVSLAVGVLAVTAALVWFAP